jgi:PKD domain
MQPTSRRRRKASRVSVRRPDGEKSPSGTAHLTVRSGAPFTGACKPATLLRWPPERRPLNPAHPILAALSVLALALQPLLALDRPDVTFKVFQFPPDRMPRIDGDPSDWAMVPDDYAVGSDQLIDDSGEHGRPDPREFSLRVKVGWVKGMNRLYFLYEADKACWDFAQPGLHNDTFEVVVDGDASGGPLIDKGHAEFWNGGHVGKDAAAPDDRISVDEAHWAIHGVQAQNYHIFTPAEGKDWCMAWGAPTWIKELPYANAATRYTFRPGEAGHLVLEFWITPFDYAGPEGPQRAVESVLREDKIIGLSWAIIDYGDAGARTSHHFWNLSRHHTMYGDASELCAFRLMPLEPQFRRPIEAQWSWSVVDMDRRLVAFKDLSVGEVTSWKWDFGDGSTSTERNPVHQYRKPGNLVVILEVSGPAGSSRRSKVWDVQLR